MNSLWLDVSVHVFHLLATVLWVGTMAAATFIVDPAIRDLDVESRAVILRTQARRLQALEVFCISILLTTGVYKLTRMGPPLPEIFAGIYGTILAVKVALVMGMLALSFLLSVIWGPRLADTSASSAGFRRVYRRVAFGRRVNLLLALGVVICSAALHVRPV